MKRVTIVISSRSDQTKKIAEKISTLLGLRTADMSVFNLEFGDAPTARILKAYDAVIVGCPVYLGDFPQMLLDWTWEHRERLNSIPSALFTVSLSAADPRPKARSAEDKAVKRFLEQTDFRPRFVASLAGALEYTKYNFIKKCLVRSISAAAGGPVDTSKDHELTNWNEVGKFVLAFQRQDMASEYATFNRFPSKQETLVPIGEAGIA